MNYLDEHKKSGIKKGDIVKVLYSVDEGHESGWNNVWNSEMNSFIGEECIVDDDFGTSGFYLFNGKEGFSFPYFVLQKIRKSCCPKYSIKCLKEARPQYDYYKYITRASFINLTIKENLEN